MLTIKWTLVIFQFNSYPGYCMLTIKWTLVIFQFNSYSVNCTEQLDGSSVNCNVIPILQPGCYGTFGFFYSFDYIYMQIIHLPYYLLIIYDIYIYIYIYICLFYKYIIDVDQKIKSSQLLFKISWLPFQYSLPSNIVCIMPIIKLL